METQNREGGKRYKVDMLATYGEGWEKWEEQAYLEEDDLVKVSTSPEFKIGEQIKLLFDGEELEGVYLGQYKPSERFIILLNKNGQVSFLDVYRITSLCDSKT